MYNHLAGENPFKTFNLFFYGLPFSSQYLEYCADNNVDLPQINSFIRSIASADYFESIASVNYGNSFYEDVQTHLFQCTSEFYSVAEPTIYLPSLSSIEELYPVTDQSKFPLTLADYTTIL